MIIILIFGFIVIASYIYLNHLKTKTSKLLTAYFVVQTLLEKDYPELLNLTNETNKKIKIKELIQSVETYLRQAKNEYQAYPLWIKYFVKDKSFINDIAKQSPLVLLLPNFLNKLEQFEQQINQIKKSMG